MSRCWWFLLAVAPFIAAVAASSSPHLQPPPAKAHHRSKSSVTSGTSFVSVWNTTLSGGVQGIVPPVFYSAPLVFMTPNDLVGVNPSTGAIEYKSLVGTLLEGAQVYGAGSSTAFVFENGNLLAFDRSSGTCRWGCGSVNVNCSLTPPFIGSINFQATSSVVFCPNNNNQQNIAGFNITTGETAWSSNTMTLTNNIPCGPVSTSTDSTGQPRQPYACVTGSSGVGVIDVNSGVVLWTAAIPADASPFIYLSASETTLTLFTTVSWVWYDIVSGSVLTSIPSGLTFFEPSTQRFGLICGVAKNIDSAITVECLNAQGKAVVQQSVPSSAFVSNMALVTKNVFVWSGSDDTGCAVQGVQVGTNTVLWNNTMGCTDMVTFFPPALASFFAVTNATSMSLFHGRTGAFIARLNQPGITEVFLSEQALGRIFVIINSVTIASYRLQA